MSMVILWRICIFTISLVSFVILCNRFRVNRDSWTNKTRDYWYAQTMWSIAGASIGIEGLISHPPFIFSRVFITAAIIVNLIGLRRKGPWGTNNER